MKRNIIIQLLLSIFIITGCSFNPQDTGNTIPEDDPPPIIVDDNPVLLALYDGNNLRYYDGTELTLANIGAVKQAGDRKLSIEDVMYYFDETGNSIQSEWLPLAPDAIAAVPAPTGSKAVVYEDEIYVLEDIPPEDAYAAGALYKHYTQVYVDGEIVNTWYLDQWEVKEVIHTLSGHVIAVDTLGHFHNLTDSISNIDYAENDGLMLYNMGTEHGYVADDSGNYEITWSMNFFDHSRWQLANDIWYTENGYTWTPGTGVISNANVLYNWNHAENYPESYSDLTGDSPYLIGAGVREENGTEVTYWLELVTGNLYRHVPNIDRLYFIIQLFIGPCVKTEIQPYIYTIDPVIVDNHLYFHKDGTIKRCNLDTTLIETFAADQELIVW